VNPTKAAELIMMPFGMWTRVGTRWDPDPHTCSGNFWGWIEDGPGHAGTCPAVDILKATQQGAEPVRCGCRLGCTRWECTLAQPGEYELVYGGDAVLCQITFTTCCKLKSSSVN